VVPKFARVSSKSTEASELEVLLVVIVLNVLVARINQLIPQGLYPKGVGITMLQTNTLTKRTWGGGRMRKVEFGSPTVDPPVVTPSHLHVWSIRQTDSASVQVISHRLPHPNVKS